MQPYWEKGILPSTPETVKELKKKHPEPVKIYQDALLTGPTQKIPTSCFDKIDENLIQKAAKKTRGAAGTSHFDSEQFRQILCNKHLKAEGKHLREQIAIFAKHISINITDPDCFESYVACRLIPLKKNPGVRPLGVGEVLRRIIGKAIGWTLYDDILNAAGPLQASAGLKGRAEAAINAMKEIYQEGSIEGIILVDTSNAFNCMNRQAALRNIQYICPPLATVLINTYRNPLRLFITGGDEILSKEGTTQGDNLAMSFYSSGTKPLPDKLSEQVPKVKQVWLADEGFGAGRVNELKDWWNIIISEGQKIGYYVNESNSWLILKDSSELETVKRIFQNRNIKFTFEGKRHLGAALGTDEFKITYVKKK